MGVLADLSGKPAEPLPDPADRKFLEIDVDNFDARMKAMKPRVAFQVPNTLTGEGNLAVDITFESMDDFSPAAVAEKVDALNKLLEARTQLSNLLTYMDGKTGAEELIAKVLNDPALLQSLAADAQARETEQRRDAVDQRIPTTRTKAHGRTHTDHRAHSTTQAVEVDEFASLLQKEFKPKTDEAREAVEQAVRTLAEQALRQHARSSSTDAYQDDRGDHRRARPQALRAGQPDPAPRRLPEARRRLARPALSGQQHRDRRDAEDPRA